MIIDEIYSAALQGNHALLESLLSRRQANLNQMYDAGTSNGVHTRLPLLFYVLNSMTRSRIDARAISLLVAYGADINGFVLMESAGATAHLPFLAYALADWNSPEMMDCLLQNGADPNGVREVIYPDGGQSAMPLLCLALQNPDAAFAEMLLRAGADPNQYADVYYPSAGYAQQLPPLYYALVEQKSDLKLSMLAAFGASAHFPITLGSRPEDSIPFKRYVQSAYPQLAPMLNAAFSAPAPQAAPSYAPQQQASWGMPDPSPAQYDGYGNNADGYDDYDSYGNNDSNGYGYDDEAYKDETDDDEDFADEKPAKAKKKKQAARPSVNLSGLASSLKNRLPEKKKAAKPKKKAEQPVVNYDPNRRCYGKFIAYLFGNFGILTLAFMIIAPLVFMGSDSEMAMIFFCIGLPCLAICALLMWRVIRKAKRYGQPLPVVIVQFILDSLLMFVRFMLMMLVVTIPLVKAIGNDIQWEQRTTSTGRHVTVKKTGDDEYEDSFGNKYSSK